MTRSLGYLQILMDDLSRNGENVIRTMSGGWHPEERKLSGTNLFMKAKVLIVQRAWFELPVF
jgi:hypothetical protein